MRFDTLHTNGARLLILLAARGASHSSSVLVRVDRVEVSLSAALPVPQPHPPSLPFLLPSPPHQPWTAQSSRFTWGRVLWAARLPWTAFLLGRRGRSWDDRPSPSSLLGFQRPREQFSNWELPAMLTEGAQPRPPLSLPPAVPCAWLRLAGPPEASRGWWQPAPGGPCSLNVTTQPRGCPGCGAGARDWPSAHSGWMD